MSEANSTPATPANKSAKPSKPYPEYPLFAHAAGVWAKKIRGKLVYFGPWNDPDAALAKYLVQKDALHAGCTPRADSAAFTVKDAANDFLAEKRSRVESGELSERTWTEYKEATDMIVAEFAKRRRVADLGPDDFSGLRKRMAKRWGPVRLGNMIQSVRSVFKFAFESDLIDRPVRFGPSFKKPSKKVLRLHRAQQGVKLFSAEEVRRIIAAASPPMRAMVYLAINGGLGNTDCGRLPLSAPDLENGWLDFARPKTGVHRRIPLWPETVEAVREAIAERPEPNDPAAGLVFITKYGRGWTDDSTITHEMRKLLGRLGIQGNRNFYCLRHCFRTIADEVKDQPAIDHIMGHARDDMASVYREKIDDERLRDVTNHVRRWLFQDASTPMLKLADMGEEQPNDTPQAGIV